MKMIGMILAALSFLGGQCYLFRCLRKLDNVMDRRSNREPLDSQEDSCGYPPEDVIE